MNFGQFFKDKKNLYYAGMIILVLVLGFGFFEYRQYLNDKNSRLEYEQNEDYEIEREFEANESADVGLQIIENENENEQKEEQKEDETKVTEVTNIVNTNKETVKKEVNPSTVTTAKITEPNMQTMLSPVFGSVCMDFSDQELIYQKTLDLWSTHYGLDIKADEGTSVRASMDGKIVEVLNDPQWGMTIVVDHGSGIITRYCNLSTLDMVKVGQTVTKGDVISGIGKTALCEIAEEPHLHFEVLKDGKHLDPKMYLPKQSLSR